MQNTIDVFFAALEKAFSTPATTTAATDDPAITAKNEALVAEVRSQMNAQKELLAVKMEAAKQDDELVAANILTIEQKDARREVRAKTYEELQARIVEARKA